MGLLSKLAGNDKDFDDHKSWLRYENANLNLDDHVAKQFGKPNRLTLFDWLTMSKEERDYYKGK